jgi:hypothetical protein
MHDKITEVRPTTVEYAMVDGYVRHWLVAGPLATPVTGLERYTGEEFKAQIAAAYDDQEPGITGLPAESAACEFGGRPGASQPEGARVLWQVVHCDDDRFVDVSGFYHTCHFLRTWAYCELYAAERQPATFVLTTNGPAHIWLNGRHIHRHLHFHHQIPRSVRCPVTLEPGPNTIMVRFAAVAVRECPYVMALEVVGPQTAGWPLHLPTTIESIARRNRLEQAMSHAYLTQAVYTRDDRLRLHWADEMTFRGKLTVRLQSPAGRIYAEAYPTVAPGGVTELGAVYQVPSGEYQLVLMPEPEEYYLHGMHVQRRLPLRITNDPFSTRPYGTLEQRRAEALRDAAQREVNVFSEVAKIALGRWSEVKPAAVLRAIDGINLRADCSDFYLVGLLGILHRYGDDPQFPADLHAALEACVLNFRYWMDEPGNDGMCFWSENHQILFHTCAVLAGQLYPQAIFPNTGQTGDWHRQKGERMALSWLHKRATGGFREWDSNTYFEEDVLALSHLADLAETVEVAELAAVVLDKLFFTLGVNSFRGVFGSTHGRTYAPYIQSAHLEPTSGLSRLLWGMGCFNDRILGTVSLACAQGYELPAVIAAIAADEPEELWNREQHAGSLESWCDRSKGEWTVNKVTYKTPDFMLSSAQDYAAGRPGYQQHIWQATLDAGAVVFVTHPPCVSEEGSHRPNSWHGNVVLPRAAQWKDVLIAVHRFDEDDWMGFTHAYFPTARFDEHVIREGWAFARKDNGYIALTAANGLQLTPRGRHARRELRSYGHRNTWLCMLGRAAWDGDFAEFQAKILALDVDVSAQRVVAQTLRGQQVAFGWEGPFLVDGTQQPLAGFPHYESPYCTAALGAEVMEIRYQDQALRLHFT